MQNPCILVKVIHALFPAKIAVTLMQTRPSCRVNMFGVLPMTLKEDTEIIELYWQRDEDAIRETDRKYHNYCFRTAYAISENDADAEECVNDTWLKAWLAMPPQRPQVLRLFLARITRNLAIDQWRRNGQKHDGRYGLILDELAECIPDKKDVQKEFEENELTRIIAAFLTRQNPMAKEFFIRRYFYHETAEDIAKQTGHTAANVRQTLSRTRKKLKTELEKEGYLS